MAFDFGTNVSALTVFLQGILSFFSPCVLPLLPIYLGYLSGGEKKEDGTYHYPRTRTFVNTLAFTLGISFVFFFLGFGFSGLGSLLTDHKQIFTVASAFIMIVFGLFHLGVFKNVLPLSGEKRLPFDMNKMVSNPLSAFLLGFTFSFAWTPCIGPIMASVLLMVGNARNQATGLILISVYILGFIIPFLLTGLFTAEILNFFRSRMNILKYTTKIGGVLLIIMGIITLTPLAGTMPSNNLKLTSETTSGGQETITTAEEETKKNSSSAAESTSGESHVSNDSSASDESADASASAESTDASTSDESGETRNLVTAFDMTLKDQNGTEHTLSDYQGKVVFLNFWATWCPPCRAEMPDIQALYEKHGKNTGDVIVLGVAGPNVSGEQDIEGIRQFLSENGYDYPVLMDETWQSFVDYQISSFPTTFMINKEGQIFGYVQGAIDARMMDQMVEQTMNNQFRQ